MKLNSQMREWLGGLSHFWRPDKGYMPLRGILTADQFNNPTIPGERDHIRRVLKRGYTTNVTVGTLTKYMSIVRQYYQAGHQQDSLEVAVISHEQADDTFSKTGDSGSIIVSHSGEFVALLTGGTDQGTNISDITYATLFEWLWDLVKAEFPGTSLDFGNIEEFLADMV